MMRRQVQAVASAGIITVVVVAVAIAWALAEYASLKKESAVVKELNNSLNDLQFLTTEYLATRTPRALKQWQARHQRMGAFIESAQIRDQDVKVLMPEIAARHKNMGSLLARLIQIEREHASGELVTAAQRVAVSRLLRQVLALSTLKTRVADIYEAREAVFLSRTPMVIALIVLAGISIMAILYVKVLRKVASSVDELSNVVVKLGNGEFDEPIKYSDTNDIGQVFGALEQARVRLANATQQMEQERADLDHFVYVASHDFKAPLRGIDNLALWIEEDAGDVLDAGSKENLQLLRRRVTRLETLLEDLLAYSRAGRLNVPIETVDIGDLIDEIMDDLNLPSGITIRCVGELPIIPSPKVPLAHVFTNLISNAVKHHDKEVGVIEISAERISNGHKFMVLDDGPGIPEKYRVKIFELFQTLKPRDVVEGSGMGLSIAKRLVQSYNGSIAVVGDSDRGTCIEFSWHPSKEKHVEHA